MSLAPFAGPRLKLRRAKSHIEELRAVLKAFSTKYPATIEHSIHPEGHPRTSYITPDEPLPEEVAAITGDAVHNMRAALDMSVCDAYRLRGKSTSNAGFPFATSAADLDRKITKERYRSGDEIAKLLRSFKGFSDGNRELRGLHDLDISDKHDIVLPISRKGLYDFARLTISVNGRTVTFVGNELISDGPSDPGLDPKIVHIESGTPSNYDEICAVFADGTPFDGEPVLMTLERLLELSTGIVEAFEKLCVGTDPQT